MKADSKICQRKRGQRRSTSAGGRRGRWGAGLNQLNGRVNIAASVQTLLQTRGRNPKPEIRNSKQIRCPKTEVFGHENFTGSDFGFLSDFDIRISDYAAEPTAVGDGASDRPQLVTCAYRVNSAARVASDHPNNSPIQSATRPAFCAASRW